MMKKRIDTIYGSLKRSALVSEWLKPMLILAYLLTGAGMISVRVKYLGLSVKLDVYIMLFVCLSLCLLTAASLRNAALRWTYAGLFFVAALFTDSYQRITASDLTYDSFINMINSAGFIGDTLTEYSSDIATAGARGLLLLFGIGLGSASTSRFVFPARSVVPLLVVVPLSGLLFVRGGEGAKGLPSPYQFLAYSSLAVYDALYGQAGPRQPVMLARAGGPIERDVVLIVDESVSGNYLDLNNARGVESGLAKARAGASIINYGYAASITNCSVGTNLTLRHGGTRQDYRRINSTMPAIWDYAKKAGLRTVYIDAQRTGRKLQNSMDSEELKAIDEFIQFDTVPVRDRDQAVADELVKHLNNRTPEFIYVNKVGAHFPVHDKYPDTFMRYQPALPRGGNETTSDTGDRTGFGGSREEWRRYRNAYRNTLLWNVGAFFDRLFASADFSRATLIYTSDHGQDLHERGTPGRGTHCTVDPQIEEGAVPLVVIEGIGLGAADWARNASANKNHASHYNIFPTLLVLMGYEQSAVQHVYGDSLTAKLVHPMTFNIVFNARLGVRPVWRTIDVSKIIAPPDDGG
jgi:lipid A ethanolaminephosphotransferase